ncbi:MAG: PTS system mannose/fructose/sorbose family transporter subunit IID [Desulfuromonadales bacterium]|nr:PTS system mannose/fructose/sorbose family transporter subunit IID [Desulfuromonadales bacterium]NIR34276.1 PTS system mannose/fructose/sorbose family transporter subunit IID [Desulfuromonadales bacterium]NIS42854.1 PTS system mannose/fructose/sorbose family transporter subunit IID [Desulfuromonadales bacterium]
MMRAAHEKLPWHVLIRVLLRSFLMQASWNFERLQNVGFMYVVAPALKALYRDEELLAAYGRHMEYFNTHPYLASPVIGTVLNLETQLANGEPEKVGVQDFKKMVMAPYAAMGDAFFWGGLRPLAACTALFFAAKGSLWAPVVFLLLFNIAHLSYRFFGIFHGYRLGIGIVQVIQRHRLPDLALKAKETTVVMLGGLCAYLSTLELQQEEVSLLWGLLILPVVVFLGWLARKGISILLLVLAASVVMLFAGELF